VFLSWSTVVPVRERASVGEDIVNRGITPGLSAIAAEHVSVLVPRGEESTVQWTLEPRTIEAPVAQGDTVGMIVVVHGDEEVARVPAIASVAVERRPWWRFWGG